uniref:RdRp n=1 Tax=Sanxia partiti-like virus 2 TaxID=1923364 RepID=A0A1L3KLV3_9VIRU|nr:RdRp [Sanxia partiti-like virus 2]
MPIGSISHPLYISKWRRAKLQGWTRSFPSRHSVDIWWKKYRERQAVASRVKWDMSKWADAVSSLVNDLKEIGPINALPLESAPSCFTDLSASAGLSLDGTRPWKTKSELPMSEIYDMWNILKNGKLDRIPPYSIAFRSHLVRKSDPPKARVVLVSPGPLAMVEKVFAEPLYRALKSWRWPKPVATGFDWFSGDGHHILAHFPPEDTISLDFSAFDLCPPVFVIRDIFRVIRSCFSLNGDEANVLESICSSHCDSMAKYGKRTFRLKGGVRTGSSFTHIVGSFLSCIMIRYLVGPKAKSVSFGDDVLLRGDYTAKQLSSLAHRLSSFTISPTKTKRGIHWLGLHRKDSIWEVIDQDRRWGQLFHPEYAGDAPGLQEQLLQSHLLAAGTGRMARELRTILIEEGILNLRPNLERELKRCVYIPWEVLKADQATNIIWAEERLKMHM